MLSLLLPEKYLVMRYFSEYSVFFHVQSENLEIFVCNMNFDEIDKNCSGGNKLTYLLHTNKLFICPKILFRILKVMICLFNLIVKLHS